MKTMIRRIGAIAVGVSLLAASAVLADGGYGGGGHGGGGYGGHGGSGGNGGYHGDGYHGGGYYGGYHGGWGGYPTVSFGFGWPYYYSDYPPTYYYVPAPVTYSAQPEVIYTSPTVNYSPRPVDANAQTAGPAPGINPQNLAAAPNPTPPAMTVADVKALVKGGLNDAVILSQMRSQHAVFHLTTEEILDLNTNKVSQSVIDFMINTANPHRN